MKLNFQRSHKLKLQKSTALQNKNIKNVSITYFKKSVHTQFKNILNEPFFFKISNRCNKQN